MTRKKDKKTLFILRTEDGAIVAKGTDRRALEDFFEPEDWESGRFRILEERP